MEDNVSTEIGGAHFTVGDQYEVRDLLGQGSFGTVVTATDRNTGKKLAIKHINPIAGSRSGATHILREVSIMRALRRHPNIINLEDVRVDSNSSTLYIVMELMECDLQRILASGQVLTAEHVKVLLKQLLLGVQAMHHQGFLHRDLKPANILLLSDCQLRITDFGLSRRIRPPSPPPGEDGKLAKNDTANDELSLTGYVVTRWYRAPEVMLGPEGGYGEPVDIWSVGCIFGEMLGSRGALFPGQNYIDQVSLTLAAVGNPGIERKDALGYELSDDALKFLQTVEPLEDRMLESLVPSDVNKDAFHLLKSLLDMNTRGRLTAQQALDHAFLRYCPRLPTTATNSSIELVDEDAPDFSFEDNALTVEELGKLIAAQAAVYEDTRRESRQREGEVEVDAPPNLQPTLSLKDVLCVVRTQARRPGREGDGDTGAGRREAAAGTTPSGGLGSPPRAAATLEKRFSSMANLAEAEEDGGFDGLEGSSTASAREMPTVSVGASAANTGFGSVVPPAGDGALNIQEAGGLPGGGRQPYLREGGGSVLVGCPSSVERGGEVDLTAMRSVDTENHRARREETVSTSGPPPSRPASSETATERAPEARKRSAADGVIATEDAAATRIQAICRRRAAQNVASIKRNKRRLTGERKVSPPVRGGVKAATSHPRVATLQQQQPRQGSFEGRGEGPEEERAASLVQKSHRQAAKIRRDRAERDKCLQDQQFLFGPGFQQRTSLTKKDSGVKSSGSSEGQSRCRDVASLTPSEEDRRHASNSRAATKIQSQVRRKAASRRAAAARQGRVATGVGAAASLPKLPIDSLVLQASATRVRAAPKVQREPLAILRQLRTDDSKALAKPRTDQFRLRVTIKSAIEAHIMKTGAARRKPRPLPTPLSWRKHNIASIKAKSLQQQQLASTTRVPLSKPRAVSPLDRTVRQVNKLIVARDMRAQAAEGSRHRARSAPSRATDRLQCAIFAAETTVEREYMRFERRPSCGRVGDSHAPADEFSRNLVASPLLVPYQPMA